MGRVVSSNRGSLVVQMDEHMEEFEFPLKRGDGIVVDRGVSFSMSCSPLFVN